MFLGLPFYIIALLWAFACLLILVVRTVFCALGHSFCPHPLQSPASPLLQTAVLFLSYVFSILSMGAMIVFSVTGILGYSKGLSTANDVRSGLPSLQADADVLVTNVSRLQSKLDGEVMVGGQDLSAVIEPVPQLLAAAALIVQGVENITEVLQDGEDVLYSTYSALQVMVILVIIFALALLLLALIGSATSCRPLVLISAFTSPVVSVVIWIVAGTLFASWHHAKDVSAASGTYLSLPVDQRLTSQLHLLLPCPDPVQAAVLVNENKYAVAALTRAVNDMIEKQYSKPAFVGLSPRPLVCEMYTNNTSGSWSAAACPFPTVKNSHTIDSWASDTSGLKCSGNNDISCGAAGTPLASALYNSIVEMLNMAAQLQAMLPTEQRVSDCAYAADTLVALGHNQDVRTNLRSAWIALTVAGVTTAILFVVLLLQHYAISTHQEAAVAMTSTSFTTTHMSRKAHGFRPGDYLPGDATAEFAPYIGTMSGHETSQTLEPYLTGRLSHEAYDPANSHKNPVFLSTPGGDASATTPRSGYTHHVQQPFPSSPAYH